MLATESGARQRGEVEWERALGKPKCRQLRGGGREGGREGGQAQAGWQAGCQSPEDGLIDGDALGRETEGNSAEDEDRTGQDRTGQTEQTEQSRAEQDRTDLRAGSTEGGQERHRIGNGNYCLCLGGKGGEGGAPEPTAGGKGTCNMGKPYFDFGSMSLHRHERDR